MKRHLIQFLLILAGLFPVCARTNPLYYPPPQAFISELFFDSNDQWFIELEMFIDYHLPTTGIIDSIVLQSHAGRTRITGYHLVHYELFVITAANTIDPLNLNPLSDTLRVITYSNPTIYNYGPPVNTHTLVYGYAGCEIPGILNGQSVCAHEYDHGNPLYFYLDDTPTIMSQNDKDGATIDLTGRFYDVHDSLITGDPQGRIFALTINVDPCEDPHYYSSWFYCPVFDFTFDPAGNYTTKLLSRNSLIKKISYVWNVGAIGYSTNLQMPCENFSFFLEPGGIMTHDIHLTDSTFLVSTRNQSLYDPGPKIVCYPHPVTDISAFYVIRDHPGHPGVIRIRNSAGKVVLDLAVPGDKQCRIELQRGQMGRSGLYLYELIEKNVVVSTGKILCR